jgi:hypothetical protein
MVYDNICALNPTYQYVLLTDDDIDALLDDYENIRTLCSSLRQAAQKKDIFSMLFMYLWGGVYFDLDSEPFVPFDEFVGEDVTFVGMVPVDEPNGLQIGFFACTQHNEIVYRILQDYLKADKNIVNNDWHALCKVAGDTLCEFMMTDKLREGTYFVKNQKILLIKETCPSTDIAFCFAEHKNQHLFGIRYHDYPWNLK